jgi:hypothetical protein
VFLHVNRFDQLCDRLVARVKERKGGERAIFLLDQYAYDDVPLQVVNSIFRQLQGAEVILTFNVDSLITYLSDKPLWRNKMQRLGLDQYIDWEGSEWKHKTTQWRPFIQQQLSNAIWKASGARFMTLFFVRPLGNNPWAYWLVHLSNKFRARDVMMALHWRNGNSFGHSLDPGLFKIGYEASADEAATGQTGLGMGEAHEFDSLLRERCINSLAEALPRKLYETDSGMVFGDLMQHIANNTTATAAFVKDALDFSVKTGDIVVTREDNGVRTKGSAIHDTDRVAFSRQRSIFLLSPVPKSSKD